MALFYPVTWSHFTNFHMSWGQDRVSEGKKIVGKTEGPPWAMAVGERKVWETSSEKRTTGITQGSSQLLPYSFYHVRLCPLKAM